MPKLLRPTAVVVVAFLLSLASAVPAVAGTTLPFQILTRLRNPIVWQNFGDCLMMTEDLTAGRVCYYYNYVTKSRMDVKSAQAGSWIPLGSAIKWLMYIDYYQGLNRLMAHDVDNHVISIARPSPQNQVGCGFAGTDCYYGQYRQARAGDHYPVDIYVQHLWGGGGFEPVVVSKSEKSQFAHDGSLMVYCAHYGVGDDRICGWYISGGPEFVIAKRPGISPSVCGSLVAWAERSGSGYDILAKDITTGETRHVTWTSVNPPCPQAGQGAIFWEDGRNAATGWDILGYDWATRRMFHVTNAPGNQVRLRACGSLVTWVSGPLNYETLWGARINP